VHQAGIKPDAPALINLLDKQPRYAPWEKSRIKKQESMKIQFARRMSAVKPSTIREILKVTEQAEIISFAGGLPAPELFPVAAVSEAAVRVLREGGAGALQYGPSEGFAPLRECFAAESRKRGIDCTAEDILITTGSQQPLDLVSKIFLDAGDCVPPKARRTWRPCKPFKLMRFALPLCPPTRKA